jgi:hypothetical protein
MFRSLFRPTLLALGFLALFNSSSLAQDTAAQIEARLAGSHGRDWIYQKVVMFMGPGDKCRQGEKYRFKADHTAVISQCVNSQMHTQTETWSIESVDPLETHIKVGDKSYILRFWDSSGNHFMALRTKAMTKGDETVDKEFQLAED